MLKILKRIPIHLILLSIFFAFAQGLAELVLPTFTAGLVNQGIVPGDFSAITRIAIQMLGVTLIIVGSALANIWFASQASQGLGKDLRDTIYAKVQRLSKDTYDHFGGASLITRSSSDIMQIELTTMMVLRMFLLAPAMLIASLVMAYRASALLSQTYLVTIPLVIISLALVLYFASPLFRAMQAKVDNMNLIFREGLTGIRVIRAFNKSDYESKRFAKANEDYRQTAVGAQIRLAFLLPALLLILNLTTIYINWFGGHLVANQQLSIGVILSFVSYTSIMGISFAFIGMMFVLIPRAQVSAERINQVLDAPEKIHSPADGGKAFDPERQARLDFDHVNYSYQGAESNVLTDINFSIKAGETLGIIGGTGSGKSTIANLILRFYERSSGDIKINGEKIESYNLDALRDYIAYVPQKANLFKGNIRSNLEFGKGQASDEEIWQNLKIAQAADFVSNLSDGIDHRVEQRGSNFSGGQKQRLCIARALMKDADILIFDDSFSALDAKTDINLRQALSQYAKDKITLIISQKVSTIRDADKILVLEDNGSVAGLGNHDTLMETSPLYASIVSSQLKEVSE
ncbi:MULTISPECIES: ABC transporter ATP-binding protein [Aerococcus]|uniref:ABC transporter ATP-binding protein n=2 Tax=Aerococcus TaxID=1375 RepID=A0A1E9PC83_9LACT|nr:MULTISPECIES: ABC transporter ATP-binding protein [Aerococcus]KAA9238624.1 ABC transporter ATP-binding protein [Aerococcus urinae]KAA9292644.1 ABC transporter ATP-binding protein [Aerococcus mictus]MBU5610010.1 ABC transporter ATP-binding protein/permease [Aerococcus urinae]MCY3034395.1 ABC transporter ATP-binding protein/permease [Aerococcus mictus]MCY3063764.1 ABC transporter ATP-binding protein/permease [Aerococcus mictus]